MSPAFVRCRKARRRAILGGVPVRALHPCHRPGCPALTAGRFCERHAAGADPRPSAARRGYGGDWRALRLRILARDPICRLCGAAPSAHADHIVPRSRGGRDVPENLQGTCARCHSRKTARHDGGFGRAPAPRGAPVAAGDPGVGFIAGGGGAGTVGALARFLVRFREPPTPGGKPASSADSLGAASPGRR